jgi:hypothetical protein
MIAGQLPARDLFAHGKNITIGRGVDRYLTPDTSATTTVRWSLSFTRVGARRP